MSKKVTSSDKVLAKFLKYEDIDNFLKSQVNQRLMQSVERLCPVCKESKPLTSFIRLNDEVISNLCSECLLLDAINVENYLNEVFKE